MISPGVRIDIPIDAARYQEILQPRLWRETAGALASVYEARVVHEGAVGGFAEGRIVELTAGNLDADVRLAFDAVAGYMSRPILAASRSAVRALGTPTDDRRLLLDRAVVRFYLVEPAWEASELAPVRPAFGVSGALRLLASPPRPQVWTALRFSIEAFEPSLVLDLRDGGAALPARQLGLLVHASGQRADDASLDEGRAPVGLDEGGRIAAEVRRRGVRLLDPPPGGRRAAGLLRLAPGVLGVAPGGPADLTLASHAVHAAGAAGLTAVAAGRVEHQRAAALAAAAGAVLSVGPHGTRPGAV